MLTMQHILEQPDIIVALSTFAISGLIWFVRLEGKQKAESELNSVRDQAYKEKFNFLNERVDRQGDKHEAMSERIFGELKEVQGKLSELVGFLRREK